MSSVVKEPTFIVGYNINSRECGLYEFRRSIHKDKIERAVKEFKEMTPKQRAKIFDCTEIQAEYMIISMISIYPPKRKAVDATKPNKTDHISDANREEDEFEDEEIQKEVKREVVKVEEEQDIFDEDDVQKEDPTDNCLNCDKSMFTDKAKTERLDDGSFCCDYCRKSFKERK